MDKYIKVKYLDEIDNNIFKYIIVENKEEEMIGENILHIKHKIVELALKMDINEICEKPKFILLDKNISEFLKEVIEDKEIKFLMHFTRKENIKSIIEKGILSRDKQEAEGIKGIISDEKRLDNKKNYISTTISFPNYKMFCRKRNADQTKDWVIIKIKSKVLIKKNCLYLPHNAASNQILKNVKKSYKEAEDLLHLFDEKIIINDKERERQAGLNKNMTTNPQAEILIEDTIEPKYFESIAVENQNIKEELEKVVDSKIKIEVEKDLFSYRSDYIYWQNKEGDN